MAKAERQDRPRLSSYADDDVLSMKDLCDLFQVSRYTIHRWTVAGLITPLDVASRSRMYRAGDVRASVQRWKVKDRASGAVHALTRAKESP